MFYVSLLVLWVLARVLAAAGSAEGTGAAAVPLPVAVAAPVGEPVDDGDVRDRGDSGRDDSTSSSFNAMTRDWASAISRRI